MKEVEDLQLIISAGASLLMVDTHDEDGVEALFRRLALRLDRPLYRWSVATGLMPLDHGSDFPRGPGAAQPPGDTREPPAALAWIQQSRVAAVYILLDFHPWLDNPVNRRLLREVARSNTRTPHTLALVGPGIDIPAELRGHAATLKLSLPDAEAIRSIIETEAAEWGRRQRRRVQAGREVVASLTRNLLGLTEPDVRRLVRTAIYDDGLLTQDDLPEIQRAKYQLMDLGGVLSFEIDTAHFSDVAGLSRLKTWLERRRAVFVAADSPPGLDPPKGILLLGVQGAGKSLAAKAVAGAWEMPLLRLDFATLYNKFYGETERNLRESLATAALMAPCVLWIDEIEKGLASDDDGGPSRRVLGTLLTWMAERKAAVFLVATANDIEALPPELLRKGRFDEIFFVDLPSSDVRRVIFEIHLKKRGQDACRPVRPRAAGAGVRWLCRGGDRTGRGRRTLHGPRRTGRPAHPSRRNGAR